MSISVMDPRPCSGGSDDPTLCPNHAEPSIAVQGKPSCAADRRPAAGGRGRRRASTADHHAVHHPNLVPQGIIAAVAHAAVWCCGYACWCAGRPAHDGCLNGQPLGTVAVDHTDWRDHAFTVPALLASGTTLEIVFDNDAAAAARTAISSSPGRPGQHLRFQPGPLQSVYDRGAGGAGLRRPGGVGWPQRSALGWRTAHHLARKL